MSAPLPPTLQRLQQWRQNLGLRWRALQPRERQGLTWAGLAVAVLVVWGGLLRPPLRDVPKARAALAESRIQHAEALTQAAEAKRLRTLPALPPLSAAQRQEALRAATQELGEQGKLSPTAEGFTLNLKDALPDAVQRWLQAVQLGAQLRPVKAELQRGPDGTWSGSITLPSGTGSGAGGRR